MFENFKDYIWYLLTTPFKKVRKSINKWYVLCRVMGKRLDEVKEDILRARDESMVSTCSHEMLPAHGADRRQTRYDGETSENFRSRISMYEEVCKLGGTNQGIILAVKSLGYRNPVIETAREHGDDSRWAEFYLVIIMNVDEEHPIHFNILKKTVRNWKEVGAKDNYQFQYQTQVKMPDAFITVWESIGDFYLDGAWNLDGRRMLDGLNLKEVV